MQPINGKDIILMAPRSRTLRFFTSTCWDPAHPSKDGPQSEGFKQRFWVAQNNSPLGDRLLL